MTGRSTNSTAIADTRHRIAPLATHTKTNLPLRFPERMTLVNYLEFFPLNHDLHTRTQSSPKGVPGR